MAATAASLLHLSIIFCLALLLPITHGSSSLNSYSGYVLPVTKDAKTLQYMTTIKTRTPLVSVNLVVDLGAQYSWVECDKAYVPSSFHRVPCRSDRCRLAKGIGCTGCSLAGCGQIPWCNVFAISVYIEMMTELGEDVIALRSTSEEGSILGPLAFINQFPINCGSKVLLQNLTSGANGMLALARSFTALPQQLLLYSKPGSYSNKFALCMPISTTAKGGIFFGFGPHIVPPPNFDVSKIFDYAPLLTNPVSTAITGEVSDEYFIPVGSINIDSIPISPLNKSLLLFDDYGVGGTKISTIDPYTTLHSSIYRALINSYVNKAKEVGIKRVASVQPFEACFSTWRIGVGGAGLAVPTIEFEMRSSRLTWKFFEPNSMVRVKKDVICLGFMDGGPNPRTSIVIGGHQLGDTVLHFDLLSMNFGCSQSLWLLNTTCANFKSS